METHPSGDRFDESDCEELHDLLPDFVSLWVREMTKCLLHRVLFLDYVSLVLSHAPLNYRHARWLPHEDVPILSEEADKHAFLFFIQIGSDMGRLGWAFNESRLALSPVLSG